VRAPVLIIKRLPANGMAIFPFILVKRKTDKNNASLINHEKIHLRQQLELLILPFYAIYLFNYLINLLVYKKHHLAYMKIVFEQEAYDNEDNLTYLKNNNWFGWIKNVRALKLP